MYQIIFAVRCETCNQILEPLASSKSVEYKHGNAEDCSEPGVTLPYVSAEQIAEVFAAKKPAKAKTVKKK